MPKITHVWPFGGRPAARLALVGQNSAWLRAACKERGISASRLNKQQMIDALVDYEKGQGA